MPPARILAGALALIVLGTVVQPDASKRVGQLIGVVSGFGRRFLDPAVPAIGAPPKSAKDQSGSGGLNLFGSLLDSLPGVGVLHALGDALGVASPATGSTASPAPSSSSPSINSLPLPTAGPSAGDHVYTA